MVAGEEASVGCRAGVFTEAAGIEGGQAVTCRHLAHRCVGEDAVQRGSPSRVEASYGRVAEQRMYETHAVRAFGEKVVTDQLVDCADDGVSATIDTQSASEAKEVLDAEP